MNVTLQLPAMYPKQRAAFHDAARTVFIEASTKAGKSVGALTWMLDTIASRGGTGLWCAPVYSQAKVMFARMVRWLTKADPTRRSGWDHNKSDLLITLPGGGGTLLFMGSDNPDSVYGRDCTAAVVDEMSRCREDAWHAVRSTLTSTRGPVRCIGNVKGRGNWAYKLSRKAQAGEPGMAYHCITAQDAVDAGVIDPQELEDAKRVYPEAVFRELYYCEPSDDGGNPFGIAAIADCVGPLSDAEPVAFGVDLAKSHDWTVVVGLDDGGRVALFDRWQLDWRQTMLRVASHVGDFPALVDATGVGDPIVEQLQDRCPAVEGFKFTATSKQTLMEGLASTVHQRAVTFPEGAMRSEMESFEYEVRVTNGRTTGVSYSAPPGMHDDCVCALALAVQLRGTNHRTGFRFLGGDPDPAIARVEAQQRHKARELAWISGADD